MIPKVLSNDNSIRLQTVINVSILCSSLQYNCTNKSIWHNHHLCFEVKLKQDIAPLIACLFLAQHWLLRIKRKKMYFHAALCKTSNKIFNFSGFLSWRICEEIISLDGGIELVQTYILQWIQWIYKLKIFLLMEKEWMVQRGIGPTIRFL